MQTKIEHITIDVSETILYSLKKMDSEGVKSLFVFTKKEFTSLLTIGDIQRAIIQNVDLNSQVGNIIEKKKKYANEGNDLETIKKKMHSLRAEFMPVVSDNGELLDVYSWKELFGTKNKFQRKLIDIPVVIMAGGKGSRLKPLTNVIPKPLIPLNEKTIIEIILDQFHEIGCSKFYLSVNYKYEILKYYIDNLEKSYDIEFFKEDKPLGTIGSVSLLRDTLKTPFFVTNCDIIIDQDYRDVFDYHIENKNEITIVSALKSHKIPYGVVKAGENGILTELSEKPDYTYMINTGVYILNSELISKIPENTFFHITQLIDDVKKVGGRVGSFPVSEKSWTDIGDWNEYLNYIGK
jgi:dTDP-glucose pyrophosphorylase